MVLVPLSNSQPFRIPVICTSNRARSQMAREWHQHIGAERVQISSAGTEPEGVHPFAIRAMDEVGIDISHHTSGHADGYRGHDFDLVLTVCDSARQSCPPIRRGRWTLHQSFEDPDCPELREEQPANVFRRTSDEIGDYGRALLHEMPDGILDGMLE